MNKIIDAHTHLWLNQDTVVDGKPIKTTTRGRSIFMGEEVQMLPPFMVDGKNSAEVFLSNMDYAQVSAAVVVQEFIDGLQNEYLADVAAAYPNRFKVCGMADYRNDDFLSKVQPLIANDVFSGIAIPGHRLSRPLNSRDMMEMFRQMEEKDKFLSLCLHEDNHQLAEVEDVICNFPSLRIVIGHFGMVTTNGWMDQISLALNDNVMVEAGGITWLFNNEFYPYQSAVRAIRKAADEVGMDKLMWGSDYPRTITAITYKMSYDFIMKSNLLDDEEKSMFLGDNARRFYRFEDLVDLPYIKNMSE